MPCLNGKLCLTVVYGSIHAMSKDNVPHEGRKYQLEFLQLLVVVLQ